METQTGFSVVGTKDTTSGRREFLEILERRVDWKHPTKAGAVWSEAEGHPKLSVHSALRRGWFFGSQAFKEKLLGAADGKLRERAGRKADGYHGSDVRDHGEKRAGTLIQAGLQHFRMSLTDLQCTPKNDSRKVLLAEMIQSETTMRLDWICAYLRMGTRSWCCHQIRGIRLALRADKSLARTREKIWNTIKHD